MSTNAGNLEKKTEVCVNRNQTISLPERHPTTTEIKKTSENSFAEKGFECEGEKIHEIHQREEIKVGGDANRELKIMNYANSGGNGGEKMKRPWFIILQINC